MAALEGKVAFITGAARGQGRAHAVKLASEGANIIAVDLCDQIASVPYPLATPGDLAATAKLVEDTGARIVARQADVRDRTSLKTALQAGLDELGRLDIVIANAGIAPMAGEDAWQDVIDVNRTHEVEFAQACLHNHYGWLTIVSIALSLLTGSKLGFGVDGQEICSALVARCLERTGEIFPTDPWHIMPADLAKYYDVLPADPNAPVGIVPPRDLGRQACST